MAVTAETAKTVNELAGQKYKYGFVTDIEQRLRHHYKDWYGYCPPDHLLLKSVAEVEIKRKTKLS